MTRNDVGTWYELIFIFKEDAQEFVERRRRRVLLTLMSCERVSVSRILISRKVKGDAEAAAASKLKIYNYL